MRSMRLHNYIDYKRKKMSYISFNFKSVKNNSDEVIDRAYNRLKRSIRFYRLEENKIKRAALLGTLKKRARELWRIGNLVCKTRN